MDKRTQTASARPAPRCSGAHSCSRRACKLRLRRRGGGCWLRRRGWCQGRLAERAWRRRRGGGGGPFPRSRVSWSFWFSFLGEGKDWKAYNSPRDETREPAVWLSIVHVLQGMGVVRLFGGREARLALAYFFWDEFWVLRSVSSWLLPPKRHIYRE